MKQKSTKFFVSVLGVLAAGSVIAFSADRVHDGTLFASNFSAADTRVEVASSTEVLPPESAKPAVAHLPTPVPLKAIYMSQCVAGTPSFRTQLITLIEETELNAVMIDVKDFSGGLAFPTQNPTLEPFESDQCGARDMKTFVETLHSKGIYVMARITVFQDPLYTAKYPEQAVQKASGGVWRDHKGLSFVDVGARQFWDYIVEVGKETYALGFDELNFDYVRFPSDGNMKDISFTHSQGKTKPEALEEFFRYLHEKLEPTGAVLSADLFGMTTTNTDDLNIGQVLERTLPYFDYIYPMVYPSHYPNGFHGYSNPNEHTYEIIKYSMDSAVSRTVATTTTVAGLTHEPLMRTEEVPGIDGGATTTREVATGLYTKPAYDKEKIRPWLQSFDYPVHYTPAMVENQIRATHDAGLSSWLFWDAGNKYVSLEKVLEVSN